jgi:hypothetical protein
VTAAGTGPEGASKRDPLGLFAGQECLLVSATAAGITGLGLFAGSGRSGRGAGGGAASVTSESGSRGRARDG